MGVTSTDGAMQRQGPITLIRNLSTMVPYAKDDVGRHVVRVEQSDAAPPP